MLKEIITLVRTKLEYIDVYLKLKILHFLERNLLLFESIKKCNLYIFLNKSHLQIFS